MPHITDDEAIRDTHNLARFFTENRHISWVLLVAVFQLGIWGIIYSTFAVQSSIGLLMTVPAFTISSTFFNSPS